MDKVAVREQVAEAIQKALTNEGNVLKVFEPYHNVGPYGGHQQTVIVAVEDEDEEIHGVVISVYCDTRTQEMLEDRVEDLNRKRALRERLTDS